MELQCPVCGRKIQIDPGDEAFYCKRCNKSFSTSRVYYQSMTGEKSDYTIGTTLKAYHGDDTDYSIKEGITRIGAGCFEDARNLETVRIPDSVVEIDDRAFANCRHLVNITLPQNLKYVGMAAFADCVLLKKLSLPSNVSYVGEAAFIRCTALTLSVLSRHTLEKTDIGLKEDQITYRYSGSSGCYITTAVCKSRGEEDDCAMLTEFRKFRDDWLMAQPGGREDIMTYYRTAPAIVDEIDRHADAQAIYEDIYQKYLAVCFDLLAKNRPDKCRQIYSAMVKELQGKYV